MYGMRQTYNHKKTIADENVFEDTVDFAEWTADRFGLCLM